MEKLNGIPKFLNQWEKVKKRGFFYYALINGGLFAVIFGLITFDFDYYQDTEYWINFLIKILIAAIIYSVLSWFWGNWRYNKLKKGCMGAR